MASKRFLATLVATLAVISEVLTSSAPVQAASREKVLHAFNGNDGSWPSAALAVDASGNLYGTTVRGGVNDDGTVFKLTPNANGKWTATVLHSFSGKDGRVPYAGVVLDAEGNLYGTTQEGGNYTGICAGSGCGVVFELSPGTDGHWHEKVLHTFNGRPQAYPNAVILGPDGSLFGTEGLSGCGGVFRLSPGADGRWTEKILHYFRIGSKDGCETNAGVVLDGAGNLYGTTYYGGAHNLGVVFELSPKANGKWGERILHSFNGTYSATDAGVTVGPTGNLYGTTYEDGTHGYGSVFELSLGTSGRWAFRTVYSFNNNDGCCLVAGVISDPAGNLYGTTRFGGPASGCGGFTCGLVFELSPGANGRWTETVLHTFRNNGHDGFRSEAGLVLDAAGNLYGTTTSGGIPKDCSNSGCGVVFEITPYPHSGLY